MNRKPVFDAVRRIIGRGFKQSEVEALDAAFEIAEGSIAGADGGDVEVEPSKAGSRKIGAKGLALIKSFEGCERDMPDGRFRAYEDPGSDNGEPWTIGWGSTGPDITRGTIWTARQCDDRFEIDVQRYADAVSRAIGNVPTTQNQFDAMVSFHYNTGAIGSATLTKLHKKGDYAGAQAEFARWNKNAGKVMRGLVRRRSAEAELYGEPDHGD